MTMIQEKNRGFTLAGFFQAAGTPFLSNLPLNNVPGYYNMIDVASAVLKPNAHLQFDYSPLNINIPMVEEVRTEKEMKVMLSVGGEDGNFHFLNGSDKVTNFYNSLKDFYIAWGFDGITFDIRQLDINNRPYIVKAIQWFHERFPKAILSLTAQATDVSPDAGGMYDDWNRMVPLINQLGNTIDWIQIMAYGYGSAFQEIQTPNVPPASAPTSLPTSTPVARIPIGDPEAMLEYIFTSFVKPFIFSNPGPESDITGTTGYDGFDSRKLLLGVLPISFLGPEYYVAPDTLKKVMADLRDKEMEAGGVMISSINDDARNKYDFSRRLTQTTDCRE